jgi:hypothetical protein
MFDGLAFEAARRTVIVVRIQLSTLLVGELPPELLSDPSSDVVAELFDFAKADGLQIDIPVAHPLPREFLGESLDQTIDSERSGRIFAPV